MGRSSGHGKCLELGLSKTEKQAEKQPFDLLLPLLIFLLLPGQTPGAAGEESLTRGLLHGFLPAVIADPSA